MIDYLEIRRKEDRELIGIIDTAKSIIWKSQYYGVGDFEIYVAATTANVEMLQDGNYVTRINNDECGIIEHIEITDDSENGRMIVASGRFIKSILDRRIVYSRMLKGTGNNYYWSINSYKLTGNVENAVRKILAWTIGDAGGELNRIIPEIDINNEEDWSNLTETIVVDTSSEEQESAEKQVTYKNLLDYTEALLQEYQLGAKMWLDRQTLLFRYKVYKGVDRSRNSKDHQPIIFSKEFDNLVSSNYTTDSSAYKSVALIGGEGEGQERKCAFVNDWIKGLDRREVFVDASSITLESESIETYRKSLEAQGRQNLSELQKTETFDGEIDLTNSYLVYGKDYNIGDLITIEDKTIGKYIDARILTITEVEDDEGYKIEIEYGV